nr:LOB domain-containing protein 15 [Ipomoea batatas]
MERVDEIIGRKLKTEMEAAAASLSSPEMVMGRRQVLGTTLNTITPCAACKLLRRRCAEECPFSPYFSPHEPHKFAAVHKVFGASNVSKMLMEVPESQRSDAANSLVYEANVRLRDPVYGCMGAISALQQQIQFLQAELNAVRAELLRHKYREAAAAAANSIITSAPALAAGAVSVVELPQAPPTPTPPPPPQPPSTLVETNIVNPQTVRPVADNSFGKAVQGKTSPDGPWMIATRKDRRQSGRQSGLGKVMETEGRTTTTGGAQFEHNFSGSRYVHLEVAKESGAQPEGAIQEPPLHREGKQHAADSSAAARPTQKFRRANVVVNENQIAYYTSEGRTLPPTEKEQASRKKSAGSGSKRAAEEDKHVVIRGKKRDQVISASRVFNGDSTGKTLDAADISPSEHHDDHPDAFYEEGDVVMDVENQHRFIPLEGGCYNFHLMFCSESF